MAQKAVHIAFYPADWLAGTRGLTPAETGVYITLVCMMYERQEALSYDNPRLARMCNCPAGTFTKILASLIDQRKLIETPAGLWNARVEREIASAREAIAVASDRAKNAADSRWSKSKAKGDQQRTALVESQSGKQMDDVNTSKKGKENNDGDVRVQCPSNANQNQNQKDDDDDDRTREKDDFQRMISEALGIDPDSPIPLVAPAEMAEARRWLELPHVTKAQVCEQIRVVMSRKDGDLPASLTYFTKEMQRLSTALEDAERPLKPARRSNSQAKKAQIQVEDLAGAVTQDRTNADPDKEADIWIGPIKAGKGYVGNCIKIPAAQNLLKRGLVTSDELRRVGVNV